MCLTISNIRHGFFNPKPKVARKNIIVYKVLMNTGSGYVTPYQRQVVFFYKGEALLSHGLQRHEMAFEWMISEGIHAFRDITSAYQLFSPAVYNIFKAIIPKGTKYFIGKENDIVSEKLIIFKDDIALEEWLEKD